MLEVRLICGILQLQSFMADVPDVPVAAVGGISGEGQMDTMCLAVFDFGFTGVHRPLVVSPCSNNFNIGSKSLDAQLKTDLVVSFSGRAMADSGCALLAGDLNQLLCNQRSCHGSAEQILVFIDSVCLYAGNDVIVTEFVDDVFDVQLGSAAGLCALLKSVKLLSLSAVNADTDNFIIKVFL